MKCMGAVKSDSVKSARKAKDKLHKVSERVSETREWTLHGQELNDAHGKPERVTRQWLISSQHTSTITCTAAPRVWHFSAFQFTGKCWSEYFNCLTDENFWHVNHNIHALTVRAVIDNILGLCCWISREHSPRRYVCSHCFADSCELERMIAWQCVFRWNWACMPCP